MKDSKICVSIIEDNKKEILGGVKKAKRLGAGLVELRLDFVKDLNEKLVLETCLEVKKENLKVILTIKREGLGGNFPIKRSEEERLKLLLVGSEFVDFVDIELECGKKNLDDFIGKIREKNKKIIISSHDFKNTPRTEEILRILNEEERLGADVCKFVCRGENFRDITRVLSANLKFRNKKKIVFCSGEVGRISRILAPSFGSKWTFSSIEKGKEGMLGQLDLKSMKRILLSAEAGEEGKKPEIVALIGSPIEHSLSPEMHNAAFEKMNLNFFYQAFPVNGERELVEFLKFIRNVGLKGANVTVPYKEDVLKYLDIIDPVAKKIGAVNTIVNENGILKGTNTDCVGFSRALKTKGILLKEKNIVLFGSGGAGRSIAFQCAQEKSGKISIINRTLRKAIKLSGDLENYFDCNIGVTEFKEKVKIKKEIGGCDILINSTSVGMHPLIKKSIIPKNFLHPDLEVIDIVYNPIETQLIHDAGMVGCKKTINGIDMLVFQGAEAFELWTKKKAPVDLMKKIVIENLSAI